MTVINNIEIDDINYTQNKTKEAVENNSPIDSVLHVVVVVSNPCLYAKRYILAKQFLRRLENTENVKIYVVELAYNNQNFYITDSKKPNHLQIKTETSPLWHKENMINIGVRRLLPESWKAMAWIDADIEFESSTWPMDTLKILNGYKDIVQIFSHAIDMDKNEYTLQYFSSFGYQYENGKQYKFSGADFWHPGFAWACTRKAYEKMGGLYDRSILGSGDHNIAFCILGWGSKTLNDDTTDAYKKDVLNFQRGIRSLRLGYVPGMIKHYFHGHKKDRKYTERWKILVDNKYDPFNHVKYNETGLLVPTDSCPQKMLDQIMEYFKERNEDV